MFACAVVCLFVWRERWRERWRVFYTGLAKFNAGDVSKERCMEGVWLSWETRKSQKNDRNREKAKWGGIGIDGQKKKERRETGKKKPARNK